MHLSAYYIHIIENIMHIVTSHAIMHIKTEVHYLQSAQLLVVLLHV